MNSDSGAHRQGAVVIQIHTSFIHRQKSQIQRNRRGKRKRKREEKKRKRKIED